jgi:hypothetical protein
MCSLITTLALATGAIATCTTRLSPHAQAYEARRSTIASVQTWLEPELQNVSRFDLAQGPKFVHFDCRTNVNDDAAQDLIKAHKALHEEYSGSGAQNAKLCARALRARDNKPVKIDAAIHVVTKKAKDAPQKQVDTLNAAYNLVGFSFKLIDTTFASEDTWAVRATDADTAACRPRCARARTALSTSTSSTISLGPY